MLGVAGVPVADAWNPLNVVVRDAPGATLSLIIDAGGLDLGEVPQRLEALVAPAGGVQRLALDLPLPSWRRITWRVEQDGRVLASGGMGARERDARRLDLLLSARPADWTERLGPDARPVAVAAADLPTRVAGWDGVRTLVIDGSVAPPDAQAVVTAAAAGVRVLLPASGPAGYQDLTRLVDGGPRAVGAGSLEPLSLMEDASLVVAAEARERLRVDAPALVAGTVVDPGWRHAAPWTIGLLASAFAFATWGLARVGGSAGWLSLGLLWAAALLASPLAAPPDPRPSGDGALVLAAGGLGVEYRHVAVASLPSGPTVLDGMLAPASDRATQWRDGRTSVELGPGGRARFVAAPRIVGVPDDVRAAPAGADPGAPAALLAAVPRGAALVRSGGTWWLRLDAGDGT